VRRLLPLFAVLLLVAGCGGGGGATRTITSPAASVVPSHRPAGAKVGHWERAYPSPDGKTLLAQWSAECEIPVAFFARGRDGPVRPVVGRSLRDAPVSVADGWTQDGRAIVEFPAAACGSGIHKPGIYFVGLDGTRSFVQALKRSVGP
jgi:hypothetical protein